MALQAVIKSIYVSNLLSDKYAEPVTFTPIATGTGRTVTMTITHRQRRDGNENTEDHTEVVECMFITDESHATVGGIVSLNLKDQFVRSSTYDPNSDPFVFNGTILEQGRHYIRAEFERYKRIAQSRGGR